jgi:drug/metabolite transporter (DMT)-like permease
MHSPLAFLLPLLAAVIYALSALFLKRATMEGGGLWRVTFLTNLGQAVLLLPLVQFGHGSVNALEAWHIAIASLVFFLGQLSVFVGMRYGDVSIVTPVMGVKVVLVAAMVTFFAHETLPTMWWIAAGISFATDICIVSAIKAGIAKFTVVQDLRALFEDDGIHGNALRRVHVTARTNLLIAERHRS